MTQKDKELLFKDLSARLPYGVILKCDSNVMMCIGPYTLDTITLDRIFNEHTEYVPFDVFKPYLFPLSSMTEEQQKEYASLVWFNSISEGWHSEDAVILEEVPKLMDFYHKNHFDYRGLIPKKLAIDCTNLNIY